MCNARLAWIVVGLPLCSASASERDAVIEEVQVTATRRALATFDVSPFVLVVANETLRATAPLTVVDYLHGEPGTFVQQTTPGQGIVILRGLKGSEVLHLVDGFRLNTAIFRNAPNQYIALVDPWTLERIEVVRGAMGALHGGDAMGGVVQFFTRAAEFDGAATRMRMKVGAQAESVNNSFATFTEGEIGNERWVAQGGITWHEVQEQRVGGGDELPYSDYSFRAAAGRAQWRITPHDTLHLQVQLSEQPNTPRYDALVPGFGQSNPDAAEHAFEPQRRTFAQARWSSQLVRPFADGLELQLGHQRIVDDRTLRDFGSSNREFEQNESALSGATVQVIKRVGARHDVVYGAELYYDRISSSRTRLDLNTNEATERPSRFPDGSSLAWASVFAQDRVDLADEWSATAAVRYSRYDIDIAATQVAPGVTLEPAAWSWSAGLLWSANEHWHWVMNIGRGFRPPNIFDLGTFGARQNRFNIPNTELEPETVMTYDAGLKYADARTRGELSVFVSRYDDKITQVLTGESDAAGRAIVQSQNATALDLKGIEASIDSALTENTSLYAALTWTEGDEEFAGARYPADRIPPLFGKVQLSHELQAPLEVVLRAIVNWAADQRRLSPRDAIDPRIDPSGTDGWTSVDLLAQAKPTATLLLTFGLDNVLDRRYREHGSGFDAAGRNVWLRAEWTMQPP